MTTDINMENEIEDFIKIFPLPIQKKINQLDKNNLIEVIVDLGRPFKIRLKDDEFEISKRKVNTKDILQITKKLSGFGDDNRAGLENTLHRISAIRNREQKIIGITARVGRSIKGSAKFIQDYASLGKSILLLGKPGIGKTTMLRELARISAEDLNKRVIIVDTSNEIAGDGDIPHYGIGNARRMQVASTHLQHKTMIEAVENHNPEVIVIDEISTKEETEAARTIAERGVQLIATAHGNQLSNLMQNPILCDLVGGIEPVTLGDEEAKRRGTQKIVLERRSPPTFETLVEIKSFNTVAIYKDTANTIDKILRGSKVSPEVRNMDSENNVTISKKMILNDNAKNVQVKKIHPYAIDKTRVQEVIDESALPFNITTKIEEADLVLTLRPHFRSKKGPLKEAESNNIPIHILRNNTRTQIFQVLSKVEISDLKKRQNDNINAKLEEVSGLQEELEKQYG
ncbi:MAG: single-stranded DNA-binding protein [Dehalococcoidaceae bacterium]|nr:single-stranded DNA-binding protein [Dehalococcoidaceae bacterium]|tara:strand:- start:13 stop:1383 length:1371 start_codon:yes stop_codon:yes gene_type:complete